MLDLISPLHLISDGSTEDLNGLHEQTSAPSTLAACQLTDMHTHTHTHSRSLASPARSLALMEDSILPLDWTELGWTGLGRDRQGLDRTGQTGLGDVDNIPYSPFLLLQAWRLADLQTWARNLIVFLSFLYSPLSSLCSAQPQLSSAYPAILLLFSCFLSLDLAVPGFSVASEQEPRTRTSREPRPQLWKQREPLSVSPPRGRPQQDGLAT